MFAVLHLADFALQAVLRSEPEKAEPAAVALLAPDSKPPRIIACTATARTRGVEPGQTSAQALGRCAELRLITPQASAEQEADAALLAAAFSISPCVETTGPGVCTLQIDGLPPGRREPALSTALDRLRLLGLRATAGTGPTPLLALYAARHSERLFMIEDERAFLATLPLAVAAPPPELAAILTGWGLRTLGDLTSLPKAAIGQRLGPPGVALWERAAGEARRPLQLVVPPPAFAAEMECEFVLETLEPLLFLLRRFVDRLTLELANAALAAAALTLTLHLDDETKLVRTLRLPEPSTEADTLFRTLHTHLETVRTEASVTGLRLELTPTRRSSRQRGLFDRALRDPHGFTETLARVAALVGADRVGTPALQNTHRPDAFTLSAPAMEIPPAAPAPSVHEPRGLILRRYRKPRIVEGVFTPGLTNHPLRLILDGGREQTVLASHGPWSSAGDWWQADQAWLREDWDIELDNGLYRLVRTPGLMLLEGEYD